MSKITTSKLIKMKQDGEKIAALTAYDSSFARLFDEQGVEVLLIGDSLGMVLQGGDSTLAVTNQQIAYHTKSVRAGAEKALVIADMPFMTYHNVNETMKNAHELMAAGANMVKMEGGDWLYDTIKQLTQNGIPVCGHLGLTPQSVNVFGGFKVQGRDNQKALEMIEHAKGLEAAGAQLLVLECIPTELAKAITDAITIPTIGIGAGNVTDGQILVMHDMFGISSGYIPKFSKNYIEITGDMRKSVSLYIEEVKSGAFPDESRSFN
ncbi:MAG: 3-methyl-2-oxobutanoate hydroxymethyltransferase [Gammaproteobacteria bacterium]|nr:3-methyl-2-oxobutanoate hydroxymethyltransferase [Gammaproteobacteria bacterium]